MTPAQDEAGAELSDALSIKDIFELIFSPSGAAIFVAAVLLVVFLVVAFYPPIRGRIFGAKWRARLGASEFEHAPADVSLQVQKDSEASAAAKAVPQEDEKRERTGHIEPAEDRPTGADQPVSARHLNIEMRIMAHNRDQVGLDDTYCRYRDHPERDVSDEELESLYAFLRIRVGRNDGFGKLHDLETSNKAWTVPSKYLYDYYMSLKAFDKALKHVDLGKSRAQDEESIIGFELRRAEVFVKQDRGGEILGELYALIENTKSQNAKTQIYEKLADVYEILGDEIRTCRALERALFASPEDKKVRFRLAWKYGENEETTPDSIYHYQLLTRQDQRYSSALNNLAADFQKLGLKGKALRLWRTAAEFDWPYPSGNLAIELAEAGFYDEAEEYIEKLPEKFGTKSRAIEASNIIREGRSKERKKNEDLNKFIDIRRRYLDEELAANAKSELRQIKHQTLIGEWKGSNSEILTINEIDGRRHVSGEFRTYNVVYRVTGIRADVLLILSAKETKKKVMPGLFGFAAPVGSSEGTWVDASISPDEFNLRLVLKSKTTLAGLKTKKEIPITERSVQEVKFVR